MASCSPLLLTRYSISNPEIGVFTNATVGLKRAALALGIDHSLSAIETLRAWKERRNKLKLLPPNDTKEALFFENVLEGADVDLWKLLCLIWHRGDGGAYRITGGPGFDKP